MTAFQDADRHTLTLRLASMTAPVKLVFFAQTFGCDTCDHTRHILRTLAELQPLLSIEEKNLVLDTAEVEQYGIEAAPGIAILGDRDYGLRFYGAPDGYELASLVEAILLASAGDSGLSEASRALVAALPDSRFVQVFSTPTCPHCPRAVRLAWQMAVESDQIRAASYSAVEYPDLVRRFRVSGVPKTVINEAADILGAVPEASFVDAVLNLRSVV